MKRKHVPKRTIVWVEIQLVFGSGNLSFRKHCSCQYIVRDTMIECLIEWGTDCKTMYLSVLGKREQRDEKSSVSLMSITIET